MTDGALRIYKGKLLLHNSRLAVCDEDCCHQTCRSPYDCLPPETIPSESQVMIRVPAEWTGDCPSCAGIGPGDYFLSYDVGAPTGYVWRLWILDFCPKDHDPYPCFGENQSIGAWFLFFKFYFSCWRGECTAYLHIGLQCEYLAQIWQFKGTGPLWSTYWRLSYYAYSSNFSLGFSVCNLVNPDPADVEAWIVSP